MAAGGSQKGRLRILCVTDVYPWPATTGYRIRVAGVLRSLVTIAGVDLFCTLEDRPDLPSGHLPPSNGLTRTWIHHRASLRWSAAGLRRWIPSGLPRAIALRDWRAPAAELGEFRGGPYDLVWFSHGDVWLSLHSSLDERTLVDLDNLESQILAAHAAGPPPDGHLVERVRAAIRRRADRLDARRWARVERRAADSSHAAIVCSKLDAARLGHPRVAVIPNGYDEQAPPAPAEGPVISMVGLLTYKPNLDGARWFADEVLPRVRAEIPHASLRLIGRYDDRARPLGQHEGVALLGEAEDVGVALAGTAVVIAPLHSGSGTRIKILEAFARRYPVAATSLGCEGIDAVDGTDLLMADSATDFADACVRLLTDVDLARAVADAGWRVWDQRYRWDVIRPQIERLVLDAGAGER